MVAWSSVWEMAGWQKTNTHGLRFHERHSWMYLRYRSVRVTPLMQVCWKGSALRNMVRLIVFWTIEWFAILMETVFHCMFFWDVCTTISAWTFPNSERHELWSSSGAFCDSTCCAYGLRWLWARKVVTLQVTKGRIRTVSGGGAHYALQHC